jgi:hypothetical protein
MDKWFKDILPDKDPYHNHGRNIWMNGSKIYFQTKIHTIIAGGTK